jgi:hypothetical protein
MSGSASCHRESNMKLEPIMILVAFGIACAPPGLPVGPGTTTDPTGSGETSTTMQASDTESDSAETDPTGFVPPEPDFPSYCDPFNQDCPEGEKCVPYSWTDGGAWDASKCVPVLGDQATGEPCTYAGTAQALDDCDATGICWSVMEVDGELVGTCHAFCTGTADDPECPEGNACHTPGDATDTLCYPTCDPVAQDCNEGIACHHMGIHFLCVFATQLPPGAPCGYFNDCAGGNLCTDAEALPACDGSACCTPYCDLGLGDDQCAAVPGTLCVPFYEQGMAARGYEHVGVCIVP